MPDNSADILRQALARNVGAVLSLPSAGMLRHHKSRLLGEAEGGILLECPIGESPLIAELIASRQSCGVSCRQGVYKVIFATPILRQLDGWRINELITVNALLLEFPSQVKSMQRRANYRADVPEDFELAVRVWRIATHAYLKEQPVAAQEVKAQIRDMSVGGVGVTLTGRNKEAPKISTQDRLRVQLTWRGESFIIEGTMRDPAKPPTGDTITTGIQFKKLEDDLEGRRILTQLTRCVGELQREEARRARLGLAKSA